MGWMCVEPWAVANKAEASVNAVAMFIVAVDERCGCYNM